MKDFDEFTVESDAWRLTIYRDEGGRISRDFSIGKMFCWGKAARLGDPNNHRSEAAFLASLYPHTPDVEDEEYDLEALRALFSGDEHFVSFPLYMRETPDGAVLGVDGNGERVGWLWVEVKPYDYDPQGLMQELQGKRKAYEQVVKDAKEDLMAELASYNMELSGNVWGFVLERGTACPHCGLAKYDEALRDSCFGFIGEPDDVLPSMAEHWPQDVRDVVKMAWDAA